MNNSINFVAGLFVGAILGAVAALLYAPKSGEELRADLQRQADVERQRVQTLYEQKLGQMQSQLDDVHKDVQTMLENAKQSPESEKPAEENA